MKIVIMDIETTGLNPEKHQIIEVGAVLFDSEKTFDPDAMSLGAFHCLIKRAEWHGEAYALHMNAEKLLESEKTGIPEVKVADKIREWLRRVGLDSRLLSSFDTASFKTDIPYGHKPPRIVCGGKNFGSFDLQFLRRLPGYGQDFECGHRNLDVTSFFMRPEDDKLPDLNTCLARAGINAKTGHDAVGDCMLVAELANYVFKRLK